jgi:hypothetical protein
MPFFSSNAGHVRGLALAGAVAALMGASALIPAFAGDDGQAPIWTGIGDLVGVAGIVGGKEKQVPIDYRERGRLVLPPKMTLPPPVSPEAERTAAWPVDQDIARVRKENEDKFKILKSQSDIQTLRDGHRLSPDQLRSDHSLPGGTVGAAHCGAGSTARECSTVPFRNVFESIGLVKSDEVVAGQEPDRDWLTDPPKGYRIPTANVAATFEEKKNLNESDPRAYLYHPPDTNNN